MGLESVCPALISGACFFNQCLLEDEPLVHVGILIGCVGGSCEPVGSIHGQLTNQINQFKGRTICVSGPLGVIVTHCIVDYVDNQKIP